MFYIHNVNQWHPSPDLLFSCTEYTAKCNGNKKGGYYCTANINCVDLGSYVVINCELIYLGNRWTLCFWVFQRKKKNLFTHSNTNVLDSLISRTWSETGRTVHTLITWKVIFSYKAILSRQVHFNLHFSICQWRHHRQIKHWPQRIRACSSLLKSLIYVAVPLRTLCFTWVY